MTDLQIIPHPKHIQVSEGFFLLKSTTKIVVSPGAESVGHYLRELLQPATGYTLLVVDSSEGSITSDLIQLVLSDVGDALGKEGYSLAVQPEAVIVRASQPAGLFYAIQTLRQLLPP